MAISTAIFRRFSARAYRRTRERLADVTATLQEDISGVRVVQAFRREHVNYAGSRVNQTYRTANVDTVNAASVYFPFVALLSAIATAVVLGYGGMLVFDGQLTAGRAFRVHRPSVQLLRPGAAAVAVLPDAPRGDGGAGQGRRGARDRAAP